jgi:hypothetical protein
MLVIIIVTALLLLANKQMVPADYESTTPTGGAIEARYLAHGSHEVGYFEQDASTESSQDSSPEAQSSIQSSIVSGLKKYEIWYPKDMETSDGVYPVIVVSNGTGVPASKATAIFEHFASWGFIVVGNEEASSWSGDASDASLAYILDQNETSGSIFYRHVDTENIGSLGHSQGGVGAINAATTCSNRDKYKAIVAESPTSQRLADSLGWSYDPSLVTVPILYLSGSEKTDQDLVIPLPDFMSLYNSTTNAPHKAMAMHWDMDHGEMLYAADGYVTAWFLYWLQDDSEAGEAFFGEDPEFESNDLYRVQSVE